MGKKAWTTVNLKGTRPTAWQNKLLPAASAVLLLKAIDLKWWNEISFLVFKGLQNFRLILLRWLQLWNTMCALSWFKKLVCVTHAWFYHYKFTTKTIYNSCDWGYCQRFYCMNTLLKGHRLSGCHPRLANNAKCPFRPSWLLAGMPAANKWTQACLFKGSLHLPGWKHLCVCHFQHCSMFMSGGKTKNISYIGHPCRLQEIFLCLRECALSWAPICSKGSFPCNRLVSCKNKRLNTKIYLENITDIAFLNSLLLHNLDVFKSYSTCFLLTEMSPFWMMELSCICILFVSVVKTFHSQVTNFGVLGFVWDCFLLLTVGFLAALGRGFVLFFFFQQTLKLSK